MKFSLYITALLFATACVLAGKVEDYANNIATLIEPAKLATLGNRGANPRVQKCVHWLAIAKQNKTSPERVATEAVRLAGYKGDAAKLTADAMLRNLSIADKLGCLDADGLSEMRKGQAATVRRGTYKGDQLSVDHIIPRSVVPELDNVIANLELMPSRMNSKKNGKVGQRQRSLAQKLNKAGLLGKGGLLMLMVK